MRYFPAVCLALMINPVMAQAPIPALKVLSTEGQASVSTGQSVPIGIPIKTGNGKVVASYNFQPVRFTLFPKGQISIDSAGYARNGARLTDFYLLGEADFKVQQFQNPYSRLRVITPSGIYEVRGTEWRLQSDGSATILGVSKGSVNSSAQSLTFRVRGGYWNRTVKGYPPEAPQPITDPNDYTILQSPSAGYAKIRLPGGNRARLGKQFVSQEAFVPLYTPISAENPAGETGTIIVRPGGLDRIKQLCPTKGKNC